MGLDLLGIGAMAQAAVEGGKAIYGASEAKKGREEMYGAIDKIKYSRPEEYEQIMSLLQQRTDSVGTRREMAEDRVRQNTAGSIAGFGQLADSPVGALGGFAQLKARESQTIADLGLQYEGIRDEAMLGEAKGLEMGAGYSDKEQYYNDMYKNMLHANIGASRMGAGQNMLWGGLEGVASTALDYAGTKYLSNVYNPQAGTQPASTSTGGTDIDISQGLANT